MASWAGLSVVWRMQFVPFRNFVGGRYGSNLSASQAYLAKEVLAEIPDQVTEFMKKNGIKPRPAPNATPASSTAPMWWCYCDVELHVTTYFMCDNWSVAAFQCMCCSCSDCC